LIIGLILFGVFGLLLLLNIPIAVCLGLASIAAFYVSGIQVAVVPQRMFTAIDSFPFMAIPFFMLAGNIMEKGGISRRLVNLANELLGPIRGGLAMTTCLACAFFGAVSGSGPGTVAAIGSIMYPEMVKQGYNKEIAAGLVAVAGGLGPIIPPSILMVTFGVVTETSIGALFLSGFGAGIVILLLLLITSYIISYKQGYQGARKQWSIKGITSSFISALPALGMPLIILGGVYGGFFTPTEAAAVAVVYSILVGFYVYKELKLDDMITILINSAISASVVLFIISTSSAFSWMFASSGLSNQMVTSLTGMMSSPALFIIVTVIIMLIFGTFMEGNAILILLMPLFFPLAKAYGIDPIYYGIVSIVAMVVGLVTPPVAVNIYTASGLSGLSMERVSKGLLPFLGALLIGLIIIIIFPGISLWLPKYMLK
jgi:C4-dicarboxylate transporter DctM subunit